MVFGQILQPSANPTFGSILSNLGSRFGQLFQQAQANPFINPLLQKYKVPEIVQGAKDVASGLGSAYQAGKSTFDILKRAFQR
jgi:hypothetical protein